MIKDDLTMSPPPTPIDLCTKTRLSTPSSPLTKLCTPEPAHTPPGSPAFTYDGITFTADISDFFTIDGPTSPPESDVDPAEVSVCDVATSSSDEAIVPGGGHDVSKDSFSGSFISAELAQAAIQAVQVDPSLGPAISSVLKTGSMMPLLKEELKCTIQTKRLAKGKAELDLSPEKTLRKEKLTPEEEGKRQRRKERNKIAAQKCRDKKHEIALELTQETEMLEGANGKLREEVKRLEDELDTLRYMVERHDVSVQCGRSMSFAKSDQHKNKPTTTSSTQHPPTQRPTKRQRTK